MEKYWIRKTVGKILQDYFDRIPVWYYDKHQKDQKGVHRTSLGRLCKKCDESNKK